MMKKSTLMEYAKHPYIYIMINNNSLELNRYTMPVLIIVYMEVLITRSLMKMKE